MDPMTIIALATLALAVLAGLVRWAAVFQQEWSVATRFVDRLGSWLMPFCFGILLGMQSFGPWRFLYPYALIFAITGVGLWLIAQPMLGIDKYIKRQNPKEPQ